MIKGMNSYNNTKQTIELKQPTPLEAFKELRNNFQWLEEHLANFNIYVENTRLHFKEDLDIIEKALKRLEEKEHNCEVYLKQMNGLASKLAKYEKEHKAFEIIKNFIHIEFEYNNLQTPHYSISASGKAHIDQEEFDLLKEVLNEIN